MRLPCVLVAPVLVMFGLAVAPAAAADCVTSGNTTICSVGGGSSGPSVPYPCQYDYYCDDSYGWERPRSVTPHLLWGMCFRRLVPVLLLAARELTGQFATPCAGGVQ